MVRNWFAGLMEGEVPFEEIEARADEFHQWNFYPFDMVESGYEDVIDKLKTYTATEYEKLDDEGKERYVDEVLAIYREKDIFPISYFSDAGIINEISKCINYQAKFDGDTVSCGAGVGTTMCKYLFPNLFDVPSQHDLTKTDAETMYKKFKNDDYLRRSIKFCFSYKNGCPIPTAVEGALRLVGSAPSNFRPMNAKAIYERFTPKGGVIYDYCCVDDETEFFNGREWKSLKDYVEGDKVLQYNEDGTAELVEPIEYIHYESDEPFYEYSSSCLNSCLTGNHDIVLKGYSTGKLFKIKQSSILNGNTDGKVPLSTIYNGSLKADKSSINSVITSFLEKDALVVEKLRVAHSYDIESKWAILKGIFSKPIVFYDSIDVLKELSSLASMSGVGNSVFEDHISVETCGALSDNIDTSNSFGFPYIVDEDRKFVKVLKRDKYCFVVPSHMLVLRRNGKIFITGNCGFGGRMLGALSSKNNYKYVGTDPNTETMYNLHRLAEYIEMATGREDSYELHCCGSEDFKGPANSVDFAFSSPPYFDLEVYSDEPTQCFNKFPELDQWLEGYVRGTIKNIYHMLKPGCCYAVNIADFSVKGGKEVAYVDEWIRISTEEGMPLYDTVYLGVTARAGSKQQAAGELKKENILIFKKPL